MSNRDTEIQHVAQKAKWSGFRRKFKLMDSNDDGIALHGLA